MMENDAVQVQPYHFTLLLFLLHLTILFSSQLQKTILLDFLLDLRISLKFMDYFLELILYWRKFLSLFLISHLPFLELLHVRVADLQQ